MEGVSKKEDDFGLEEEEKEESGEDNERLKKQSSYTYWVTKDVE